MSLDGAQGASCERNRLAAPAGGLRRDDVAALGLLRGRDQRILELRVGDYSPDEGRVVLVVA